jgi:threonine synthase
VLPSELVCSRDASHRFVPDRMYTVCETCGAALLVHYPSLRLDRTELDRRPWTMWRYREVLPIDTSEEPVTLGEGATPLLEARRTAQRLGMDAPLYVKDESQNPTASFKSRGMSVAVTCAKRLGATALVAPSAGNAGGALAAYGARAGLPVTVFLPRDTPPTIVEECNTFGAAVEFVDGVIDEAGHRAAEFAKATGAFNVATLREPYRIEGKKTMAYELVEQLGGVPAAVVYPTGGGTGLIGMWKAFDEMQWLGWIGSERPVMIAVQAEGCAPIVRAFDEGSENASAWPDPQTSAWGLRVPGALGDHLILRAVRQSGGQAIAVAEKDLLNEMRALRTAEGIDASEEGGTALAGLRMLLSTGFTLTGPMVVFNTGSALKYAPRASVASTSRNVGVAVHA